MQMTPLPFIFGIPFTGMAMISSVYYAALCGTAPPRSTVLRR